MRKNKKHYGPFFSGMTEPGVCRNCKTYQACNCKPDNEESGLYNFCSLCRSYIINIYYIDKVIIKHKKAITYW